MGATSSGSDADNFQPVAVLNESLSEHRWGHGLFIVLYHNRLGKEAMLFKELIERTRQQRSLNEIAVDRDFLFGVIEVQDDFRTDSGWMRPSPSRQVRNLF